MMACFDVTEIAGGLSALLTPVIAVVTVSILVLQYLLARRRWRLDLYDKRYPVFMSTMDYISSVVQTGGTTADRTTQFLRETKDREFLFGKEIHDFLGLLYKKGVDLWTAQETTNAPHANEDDRKALIYEARDLKKWFGDQFEVAKRLFDPYLRITKK